VLGSKIQIWTQVIILGTWTCIHPDWLWLDTHWRCSNPSIWARISHFHLFQKGVSTL